MQCQRWAGIDRTNTTLDTYITKYGDHRYISTRGPDYKTKYVYAVKSFTNKILDRGGRPTYGKTIKEQFFNFRGETANFNPLICLTIKYQSVLNALFNNTSI